MRSLLFLTYALNPNSSHTVVPQSRGNGTKWYQQLLKNASLISLMARHSWLLASGSNRERAQREKKTLVQQSGIDVTQPYKNKIIFYTQNTWKFSVFKFTWQLERRKLCKSYRCLCRNICIHLYKCTEVYIPLKYRHTDKEANQNSVHPCITNKFKTNMSIKEPKHYIYNL